MLSGTIPFNRYKKKSLMLLYRVHGNISDILSNIKNKKLASSKIKVISFNYLEGDEINIKVGNSSAFAKIRENILAWADQSDIVLCDIHARKLLKNLKGHKGTVIALIKLNETKIVSACTYDFIKLWDWTKGTCLKNLKDRVPNFNSLIKVSETKIAFISQRNGFSINIRDLSTNNSNLVKKEELVNNPFLAKIVKTILSKFGR